MKIAFIVPSMGMGGAERVISIISDELIQRGHTVTIGMFFEEKLPVAYKLNENIGLEYVKSYRFNTLSNMRKSFASIEAYLKKISPDVVISFTNVICARCSIICKKLKIPVIFSERNDPTKLLRGWHNKVYQKILTHNVKNVVFQTNGAKALYPQSIQKRSIVIVNPLDSNKFPPYYEGERKKEIVSVGRLELQKNQKMLVDSFAQIANDFPEYTLKIYGDGSLREPLTQQINALNLQDRVLLMGKQSDIFNHINDAAVFAFTSDFEGIPNALIEAMALGLPCVATRCSPGGAEEFIEDGVNGYLVDCGDVDGFAVTLRNVLQKYDDSLLAGKKASNVRVRTSVKNIVDLWETYIKKVLYDKK